MRSYHLLWIGQPAIQKLSEVASRYKISCLYCVHRAGAERRSLFTGNYLVAFLNGGIGGPVCFYCAAQTKGAHLEKLVFTDGRRVVVECCHG